eukprot:220433-Alexandrium_andersonii.AAC.1
MKQSSEDVQLSHACPCSPCFRTFCQKMMRNWSVVLAGRLRHGQAVNGCLGGLERLDPGGHARQDLAAHH